MTCTSMMPCLPSGLAKNNKIMFMLVVFSLLFGHFESLTFFENRGTNLTPKQSSRMFLVNFSKISTIKLQSFLKAQLF